MKPDKWRTLPFLENHRQALIISPLGEWGDKVSGSFAERWTDLGGEVIAVSPLQWPAGLFFFD